MCDTRRRKFIGAAGGALTAMAFGGGALAEPDAAGKRKVYTCPQCGCPNDGKAFDSPGPCTVCEMPLMEKPAAPDGKAPGAEAPGSASLSKEGGATPDRAAPPLR